MIKHSFILAGIISGALILSPAQAQQRPYDSWGKADIAFETYRDDALECALTGYYADVSGTEQAHMFQRATQRLQTNDDHSMGAAGASVEEQAYRSVGIARQSELIQRSIRPERRMRELEEAMVGLVEQCLMERGYSQFRLTEEQQDALGRLRKGTDERHQFLYGLASDPEVLAAQAVPANDV